MRPAERKTRLLAEIDAALFFLKASGDTPASTEYRAACARLAELPKEQYAYRRHPATLKKLAAERQALDDARAALRERFAIAGCTYQILQLPENVESFRKKAAKLAAKWYE